MQLQRLQHLTSSLGSHGGVWKCFGNVFVHLNREVLPTNHYFEVKEIHLLKLVSLAELDILQSMHFLWSQEVFFSILSEEDLQNSVI